MTDIKGKIGGENADGDGMILNGNLDNNKTGDLRIAYTGDEKKEIIQEAKQIVDLKELVTSILMVSDLSRQRE